MKASGKIIKNLMKKSYIYIAAIALIAACTKTEVPSSTSDIDTISARIEQETADTKTHKDANNNILWSEGDQIVGFMKTSLGQKYQIKDEYIGKTSGYFSQVPSDSSADIGASTKWDYNVVYYPYSTAVEAAKHDGNYVLNVILPSTQTYVSESFGEGAMAMVAVSENTNFTFRNVLGGMKLQLKGAQKVSSITLKGKNSEKLSGAATVTAYTGETKPAITMTGTDDASQSVTLNCGSGVQLNESTATEFILAIPPVIFSNGFTVMVTDSDSQTYSIETSKRNTVIRSSLLVMPAVTIGSSEEENPEITTGDYVDEYGKNRGPGVKIGETVWAPVNCGYHETDFRYGKLYQWGRKYGQGYDGFIYGENTNVAAGTYSDATLPTLTEGGVSESDGNHKNNANVFYIGLNDWVDPRNDKLWNSGTEENPVKTEYDPCPDGWRVPTYAELKELCKNHSSWTTEDSQNGYWLSGASSYSESISQVFFPAGGRRDFDGKTHTRGGNGRYWSSRPYEEPYEDRAYYLQISNGSAKMKDYRRAAGYSVRCVQE